MGEATPGEDPRGTAGLSHLVQVAELQGVGKSPGDEEEWLKTRKKSHQASSRDVWFGLGASIYSF